ncbi:MAG: protein translocase subunit SecD [Eubacterium sp.]|nr:protein translocase subunit SecD [Eubacterium sp.]
MKKAKRNAILGLLVFVLLTAGAVYSVLQGLGADKIGLAKDIPLGLDLQGGVSVTYEIQEDNASDEEINATIDKLQRRADTYSNDAEVYKQGNKRIVIEIPVDTSKYDPNEILDAMGRPGKLEFLDPENYEKFSSGSTDYTPALTGSDVKNAQGGRVQENTGEDEYIVSLQFTDEGAKKFSDVTGANVGNPVYIIYDGSVVSAPTVREQISGGSAQIDGMEDYDEASNLASTIKIGALPLTLNELSSQVVGAKLGTDALRTSLIAGAIGLCIIFLLMIIIFRFPGFISAIALSVYTVLELFFLNAFHITLTLPGIAGIILSIGMAVDANVIIFTRIKEEIGVGKTVKTAVKSGFHKAMSAIIDGNITTIIAGIVLLIMGTGTVKGFARTLILGIVLSMFTALIISRFLLTAFVDLGVVNKKLYGAAKQPKITKYTKGFRFAALFSAIVILAGIAFLFVNKGIGTRGNSLNYSLEFSGGTSTSVTFNEAMTLQEAEEKVLPVFKEVGVDSNVQIQTVDNSNQIVFKSNSLNEDTRSELASKLKETFDLTDDKIDSENISSTISQETQRDAVLAVVIASILMLIYIAIRFSDVRFGASAVIALIHDVMFVFFAYAAMYLTVGGTFIACMLTIVGYSINSSIIIFDRIRENLKTMSIEKDGYETIVNTSISQTFTRNIYTNLTTFITILMLNILGVASLKEFTFTLMVGVVAGTYSSICITGPLWLWLRTKITKKSEEKSVTKKA